MLTARSFSPQFTSRSPASFWLVGLLVLLLTATPLFGAEQISSREMPPSASLPLSSKAAAQPIDQLLLTAHAQALTNRSLIYPRLRQQHSLLDQELRRIHQVLRGLAGVLTDQHRGLKETRALHEQLVKGLLPLEARLFDRCQQLEALLHRQQAQDIATIGQLPMPTSEVLLELDALYTLTDQLEQRKAQLFAHYSLSLAAVSHVLPDSSPNPYLQGQVQEHLAALANAAQGIAVEEKRLLAVSTALGQTEDELRRQWRNQLDQERRLTTTISGLLREQIQALRQNSLPSDQILAGELDLVDLLLQRRLSELEMTGERDDPLGNVLFVPQTAYQNRESTLLAEEQAQIGKALVKRTMNRRELVTQLTIRMDRLLLSLQYQDRALTTLLRMGNEATNQGLSDSVAQDLKQRQVAMLDQVRQLLQRLYALQDAYTQLMKLDSAAILTSPALGQQVITINEPLKRLLSQVKDLRNQSEQFDLLAVVFLQQWQGLEQPANLRKASAEVGRTVNLLTTTAAALDAAFQQDRPQFLRLQALIGNHLDLAQTTYQKLQHDLQPLNATAGPRTTALLTAIDRELAQRLDLLSKMQPWMDAKTLSDPTASASQVLDWSNLALINGSLQALRLSLDCLTQLPALFTSATAEDSSSFSLRLLKSAILLDSPFSLDIGPAEFGLTCIVADEPFSIDGMGRQGSMPVAGTILASHWRQHTTSTGLSLPWLLARLARDLSDGVFAPSTTDQPLDVPWQRTLRLLLACSDDPVCLDAGNNTCLQLTDSDNGSVLRFIKMAALEGNLNRQLQIFLAKGDANPDSIIPWLPLILQPRAMAPTEQDRTDGIDWWSGQLRQEDHCLILGLLTGEKDRNAPSPLDQISLALRSCIAMPGLGLMAKGPGTLDGPAQWSGSGVPLPSSLQMKTVDNQEYRSSGTRLENMRQETRPAGRQQTSANQERGR